MNLFEQVSVGSFGLEEYSSQIFYHKVISLLKNKEWFKVYEEYCLSCESFVHPRSNTPIEKFRAHAKNTQYSKEQTDKISALIKTV